MKLINIYHFSYSYLQYLYGAHLSFNDCDDDRFAIYHSAILSDLHRTPVFNLVVTTDTACF